MADDNEDKKDLLQLARENLRSHPNETPMERGYRERLMEHSRKLHLQGKPALKASVPDETPSGQTTAPVLKKSYAERLQEAAKKNHRIP